MLKVYKALQDIRKATEKVKADMELDEVLQEYVVRSEPLGYDRYFNEYYCFRATATVCMLESEVSCHHRL